MEVLSKKELKKVIVSIDGYNDYGLDTFSDHLMDYCEELSDNNVGDITTFIEEELEITTDAELKEADEDAVAELCDFINQLFD